MLRSVVRPTFQQIPGQTADHTLSAGRSQYGGEVDGNGANGANGVNVDKAEFKEEDVECRLQRTAA